MIKLITKITNIFPGLTKLYFRFLIHKDLIPMDLCACMYDVCRNLFCFDVDNSLKKSLHHKFWSWLLGQMMTSEVIIWCDQVVVLEDQGVICCGDKFRLKISNPIFYGDQYVCCGDQDLMIEYQVIKGISLEDNT